MPGFRQRKFLRDERGAVSVVAALSLFVLLALGGIVIDAGSLYFARRDQQAVTDAAALAAVQSPTGATGVASQVFARNAYVAGLVVTSGTYVADESRTVANRFTPSSSGINAVRVRASVVHKAYFAGLFGLPSPTLVTQATASRLPTVSFGAGTRLASLNAGLINSFLGQAFGTTLSLSLLDYQSLVKTNVDALTFLKALATQVGVSGSYQDLANANVSTGQLLAAAINAASTAQGSNQAAALLALKSLQMKLPGGTPMILNNLIDLSPLYGRSIGGIASIDGTGLKLNLMSLLSANARAVSAGQLLNLGSALTVPVTNTSIVTRVAMGNQMTRVSAGQAGSGINTAQVRVAMDVTLANLNLGILNVPLLTIKLPIYVEGASGQATLTDIPCQRGGTLAKIAATTGAAKIRFGTVSDTVLKNFAAPVTPVDTPIATINLLGIGVNLNVTGGADVASSGPTSLSFSQADIDAGTVRSAPVANVSPFTTLGTNLGVSATILGVPGILGATLNALLSGLLGALKPVLAALVTTLDPVVTSLLTTLGIQLGIIDVQVFDAQCRIPTLVG